MVKSVVRIGGGSAGAEERIDAAVELALAEDDKASKYEDHLAAAIHPHISVKVDMRPWVSPLIRGRCRPRHAVVS